jgi:hypothetical protein
MEARFVDVASLNSVHARIVEEQRIPIALRDLVEGVFIDRSILQAVGEAPDVQQLAPNCPPLKNANGTGGSH